MVYDPQSSLSAPMSVMGRIIGTIEVQTYEKSAYREEHVTAMRMAANLTAVAIENVGLLERESTARAERGGIESTEGRVSGHRLS